MPAGKDLSGGRRGAKRQPGERARVARAIAENPRCQSVGSHLLFESQLPGQPVYDRVIEVRHDGHLAAKPFQKVALADVRQFMGEHGPQLIRRPLAPHRGQQNYRPPPAARCRYAERS